MPKKIKTPLSIEQTFGSNLEAMYTLEPMRLLAFAKRLQQFGDNDRNLILRGIVNWYVKGEFFERHKKVKLRRPEGERLTSEFISLIENYNRMPDRFVGEEIHNTMLQLMPDPSLLMDRVF